MRLSHRPWLRRFSIQQGERVSTLSGGVLVSPGLRLTGMVRLEIYFRAVALNLKCFPSEIHVFGRCPEREIISASLAFCFGCAEGRSSIQLQLLKRELRMFTRYHHDVIAIEAFKRSYAQVHAGRLDSDEHRGAAVWARMEINCVGREAKERV